MLTRDLAPCFMLLTVNPPPYLVDEHDILVASCNLEHHTPVSPAPAPAPAALTADMYSMFAMASGFASPLLT
jgi:hypothetical protein